MTKQKGICEPSAKAAAEKLSAEEKMASLMGSQWLKIRVFPDVSFRPHPFYKFNLSTRRRGFSISASAIPATSDELPRNKVQGEVRVRFAPSPTGNLHVGGARTALFNYLFARFSPSPPPLPLSRLYSWVMMVGFVFVIGSVIYVGKGCNFFFGEGLF